MIQSNAFIPTYQFAAGQYATIKTGFVSDQMLTGKAIRFNPGIYNATGKPNQTAFQLSYPLAPGTYEFNKIACKNGKAFIIVHDAYNFDIEFRFFVTKNLNGWIPDVPHINGSAFNVAPFIGSLGFYVRANSDFTTVNIPIEINGFCESPVAFELKNDKGELLNGYVAGQPLSIDITTIHTVSNNYFVGLIKADAISNNDIIEGLILSYAKIGSTVSPVYDLPNDCFQNGLGFMQQGSQSKASITINGSCLNNYASYKVYVVFYADGIWQSCISDEINQISNQKAIEPKITSSFEDEFGNTTEARCIKGLSRYVKSNFCITIDEDDFNDQLTALGLSGTFSDYNQSLKAFVSNSINDIGGSAVLVSGTFPTFCINDFFNPLRSNSIFLIFQLKMVYPTHSDLINIPFELVFDAETIQGNYEVFGENGEVSELCAGEDYIISQDFNDCILLQSVNGGNYTPSTLIEEMDLLIDSIPMNTSICFKSICDNTSTDGGEEDCDCDHCGSLPFRVFVSTGPNPAIRTFVCRVAAPGTIIFTETVSGITNTVTGGSITEVSVNVPYPQSFYNFTINFIGVDTCTYIGGTSTSLSSLDFWDHTIDIKSNGCECEEEVIPQCKNYAAVDIDCDEDSQTISISLFTSLESSLESEEFLCSLDGGKTFIPCPSAVVGQPSIFITYDAKFTDGCEPIHLEQVVVCNPNNTVTNFRTIDLTTTDYELNVVLTSEFSSTPIQDTLFVSIDGGKSFKEFNLLGGGYIPIELKGGESIIAYTNTIFDDGFSDLLVSKTIFFDAPSVDSCSGYDDYDLDVVYDEENATFIVNTSGERTALEIDQLLWTINGGNPLDDNNSGVPYHNPVQGEGMFIVRWRIKLEGCQVKIIDGVAFGKSCIKLCDDVSVNVNIPNQPLKMCIVECCDEDYSIICEDHTLTVEGTLEGCTISWTGPSGFTASGNNIEVTEDGTYYANIKCEGCEGNASYTFEHANSGTPINGEIDI